MGEELVFRPARSLGVIFHLLAMVVFLAVAGAGLWQAFQASAPPIFTLYLVPGLLAATLVPVLAYRFYSLQSASYTLERDGVRLRWGLRMVDIPMSAILWVHPTSEVSGRVTKPWLRWPGAVLGVRRLPGGGEIEYLAAGTANLILIAAHERIYAVSPARPQDFLQAFQRLSEMGSLAPFEARSIYPTFLLSRVWATVPARVLVLAGLLLSLALLVVVSLVIPSRSQIHLGFRPDQSPSDLLPAIRLFLLPILSAFFFLVNLLLGLFFFRHEESQPLSYLLWSCGVLTPLLFFAAIFFIIASG